MNNKQGEITKKGKIFFLISVGIVSVVTFSALYVLDLVPNVLRIENNRDGGVQNPVVFEQSFGEEPPAPEYPVRVSISKIAVDTPISNPTSTNIATLDEYLLEGAVRYPGSGLLGQGNMFLFAHSTGFSVVNNQAYKAFNGLHKLVEGDEIVAYSNKRRYVYEVRSVTLVDKNEALVEFSNDVNMLTLSTCNSFGRKDDRYVVEADLVSTAVL